MSLPLGTTVPDFSLPNVCTDALCKPSDFSASQALLVIFLCRHCPYVVHIREALRHLAADYQSAGLAIVGICSNDPVAYPEDAPAKLAEMVHENSLTFPILFDATQEVARAFTATCTPDFFLFDSAQKLAYRGRLDDSTPGNGRPVTGADLRAALEATLRGDHPTTEQFPSMGCSIKWRPYAAKKSAE